MRSEGDIGRLDPIRVARPPHTGDKARNASETACFFAGLQRRPQVFNYLWDPRGRKTAAKPGGSDTRLLGPLMRQVVIPFVLRTQHTLRSRAAALCCDNATACFSSDAIESGLR